MTTRTKAKAKKPWTKFKPVSEVDPRDVIPDVRDGLTRVERIVLFELQKAQAERDGRGVPSAQLYGRVVEHGVNLNPDEFQRLVAKLTGR